MHSFQYGFKNGDFWDKYVTILYYKKNAEKHSFQKVKKSYRNNFENS